jgi:hypothetical protein
MSLLTATQIPKPSDEQAFERACVPLWRGLLKDPNVQKNARRGQGQDGVDLYGMRDQDPHQYVGIQCKLKGDGKRLSEKEVRDEVEKAVNFKPSLREYFIVTTAPDDGEMHELARVITAELKAKGSEMLVYIWGWNTLEERISEDDEARKAFDPSFGPFSARILDNTEALLAGQSETRSSVAQIQATLTQLTSTFTRHQAMQRSRSMSSRPILTRKLTRSAISRTPADHERRCRCWRGCSRAWRRPPRAAFFSALRPISASASSLWENRSERQGYSRKRTGTRQPSRKRSPTKLSRFCCAASGGNCCGGDRRRFPPIQRMNGWRATSSRLRASTRPFLSLWICCRTRLRARSRWLSPASISCVIAD